MKKSLIYILSIIFSLVLCGQIKAKVTGVCSNCHTMHNSQGGSEMAVYGPSSGVNPNPCLTLGDCVGCHAYNSGTGDNVEEIGGSLVPQVWHIGADLAAGNFRYIATGTDDNKGHNVFAIEQENNSDMFPPPGYETDPEITATNFSCAGKYGCHGDRTVTGETTSMKGAHHADDSTIDGLSTGTSYRFLKGVLGLENNGDNPWQNASLTDHNEYKGLTSPDDSASDTSPGTGGSISGFCAECHEYYHGDDLDETGASFSPWIRHPTDISLPSSGEYKNYINYSIVAPLARVTLPETPSDAVTPTGTNDDIVMCLSCHGAHATNFYKLMRWDYNGDKGGDLAQQLSGCNVCHTSKMGGVSYARSYLDSAHGTQNDAITGVSRLNLYTDGHCAHCHEQHASIGGDEPSPDSPAGPDDYLLFSDNHTSQTVNFCFDCHCGTTQTGGIFNRSYSYRAGDWSDDTPGDIFEAFKYGPPTNLTTSSSHRLDDISTFINGKWGYTANSNPCTACHNPHAAQGDPANSPNNAKSFGTRGYPVSLPSDHVDKYVWDVYGDDTGEKMRDYSSYYQAPYRSGSTSVYEPDGSTTIDGTNLTDYVTFCTDCHHYSPTPVSSRLGDTNLKDIDWSATGDYHGNKDGGGGEKAPYTDATNYVLACTDCHEPHGSPNYCYLIRKEVNGGTTDFSGNTRAAWDSLCIQCHTSKLVSYCSGDDGSALCSVCHSHGSNF